MERETRPSAYLAARCAEFEQVLSFFLHASGGKGPAVGERLVVFLSQLGFWDWELDNLLYAFATFAERSKAWNSTSHGGLAAGLELQGLPIRAGAVRGMGERRENRAARTRQVVAPVEDLRRVLRVWDELLTACEERVLLPPAERAAKADLGVHVLPDLGKYRKALPAGCVPASGGR